MSLTDQCRPSTTYSRLLISSGYLSLSKKMIPIHYIGVLRWVVSGDRRHGDSRPYYLSRTNRNDHTNPVNPLAEGVFRVDLPKAWTSYRKSPRNGNRPVPAHDDVRSHTLLKDLVWVLKYRRPRKIGTPRSSTVSQSSYSRTPRPAVSGLPRGRPHWNHISDPLWSKNVFWILPVSLQTRNWERHT